MPFRRPRWWSKSKSVGIQDLGLPGPVLGQSLISEACESVSSESLDASRNALRSRSVMAHHRDGTNGCLLVHPDRLIRCMIASGAGKVQM